MDELQALQQELSQVKHQMDIEIESGLGCTPEHVHRAAEILNRIRKLALTSSSED